MLSDSSLDGKVDTFQHNTAAVLPASEPRYDVISLVKQTQGPCDCFSRFHLDLDLAVNCTPLIFPAHLPAAPTKLPAARLLCHYNLILYVNFLDPYSILRPHPSLNAKFSALTPLELLCDGCKPCETRPWAQESTLKRCYWCCCSNSLREGD